MVQEELTIWVALRVCGPLAQRPTVDIALSADINMWSTHFLILYRLHV